MQAILDNGISSLNKLNSDALIVVLITLLFSALFVEGIIFLARFFQKPVFKKITAIRSSEKYVGLYIPDWTKLDHQNFKTNSHIVVEKQGHPAKLAIMQKKYRTSSSKLVLPEELFDSYFPNAQDEAEQSGEFQIRPMNEYHPLNLWNHPNIEVQIGVRLAVFLLIVELFL